MTNERGRRGFNLVEAIVVVAILALFLLAAMSTLPRRLEVARRTSCQKNLMQIGAALVLYDQSSGRLPAVPELGTTASGQTSPLRALLEQLGLPDLQGLDASGSLPSRQPGFVARAQPVPGFTCPSDRHATSLLFAAPVSYRATTGDTPDGRRGAFATGGGVSLAEIEAGDGAGFTAAFSERLAGNDRPIPAPTNYAITPGPLAAGACPPAQPADWKGDAGSSWISSTWASTLYHHAMVPNASPSCVSQDGRSAFMGASSAHPVGVNVLFFDGSVKIYTPTVAPSIWRGLATTKSAATP